MSRFLLPVSLLGAALFIAAACWLAHASRQAPAHEEARLDDGTPLSIFLPAGRDGAGRDGAGRDSAAFRFPAPAAERPPVVVLMHGFAGDRNALSPLAWRLARAGYAVMTFDAPGHGANRNPYLSGGGRPDVFVPVWGRVVDFARSHPFVDGLRVAVGGHSMGAHAALEYATRDSGLDATLLLSGGRSLTGPYRPSNALFLIGEFEPSRIARRVEEIASRVAEGELPRSGGTVGSHRQRTAVRGQVILGAGHADIASDPETASEIVAWLDASYGHERRGELDLVDPRGAPVRLAGLALLLCLPGLGQVAARLARPRPEPPTRGLLALPIFGAAILLTLPVIALGTPLSFLSVEVADVIASHFALAGSTLLVLLAATGRFDLPIRARDLRRSLLAAGVVGAALLALLQPIGVRVHAVAFTPERVLLLPALLVAFLPLSLAFELYLRRGPAPTAALRCFFGRALVVASLLLAVSLGLLVPTVGLMIGALATVFLVVEVIAWLLYARSHDSLTIALVDAAALSLVFAIVLPVRI